MTIGSHDGRPLGHQVRFRSGSSGLSPLQNSGEVISISGVCPLRTVARTGAFIDVYLFLQASHRLLTRRRLYSILPLGREPLVRGWPLDYLVQALRRSCFLPGRARTDGGGGVKRGET